MFNGKNIIVFFNIVMHMLNNVDVVWYFSVCLLSAPGCVFMDMLEGESPCKRY